MSATFFGWPVPHPLEVGQVLQTQAAILVTFREEPVGGRCSIDGGLLPPLLLQASEVVRLHQVQHLNLLLLLLVKALVLICSSSRIVPDWRCRTVLIHLLTRNFVVLVPFAIGPDLLSTILVNDLHLWLRIEV